MKKVNAYFISPSPKDRLVKPRDACQKDSSRSVQQVNEMSVLPVYANWVWHH